MENRNIRWSAKALKQFGEAINYILNESVQNAEKVRFEILEKIAVLPKYPNIYARDKYKTENDGSYRAFELHRYRIAYRISKKEIRIIRLRHTSMEPLMY